MKLRAESSSFGCKETGKTNQCGIFAWSFYLLFSTAALFAQVGPAEIGDPRLKAAEQAYLPQLLALNKAISGMKFPFRLSLNRQVGLDPKDQIGADTRGLEFVNFHNREVLKFTGNYNAAFNTSSLTPNRRAERVLNEVILPIVRLLPDHFKSDADFDAFGFEIGYHVRKHTSSYDYEGKEILVVVFDKTDALRYGALQSDSERQAILNASEIFLNGKPFGLALNADAPYEIEMLTKRQAAQNVSASKPERRPETQRESLPQAAARSSAPLKGEEVPARAAAEAAAAVSAESFNPETLQKKYQSELDNLNKEGIAKYHFADYASPAFISFRNQPTLLLTLRNPTVFDKEAGSIYRRAARTMDLFLAPQLQGILQSIPNSREFNRLNITVVNDLISSGSSKSAEAIEFIFPIDLARRFAAADITNQDLINDSIVLVNGVRISLNLAQVE